MAGSLNLQNFSASASASPTLFLPRDRLSQIKADALQVGHDRGYQQARDELDAQNSETASLLSDKLQAIAFSHFEARKSVLDTLEPLIRQMVDLILPALASDALADVVAAQVLSVAALITDSPIRVSCAPENAAALEAMIARLPEFPVPVMVVGEAELQPLEVRLTTSESERHLDIARILDGIRDGVSEFYKLATKEKHYG
jgi:flagellar biosynthesis/type III secretory pathway protein FliH